MLRNVLLICFYVFTLSACHSPPDRPSRETVLAQNPEFSAFLNHVDHQPVYGVQVGEHCDAAVLFIHGTPGGWGALQYFMSDTELQNKANLISVDRPGFGQSSSEEAITSLEEQARLILESALAQHPGPFVLVGHSYGGPIELQIAIDAPDNVASLIILAGPADPDLHHPRWYHRMGNTWLGRRLTSEPLNRATDEMLDLRENLEAQAERLGGIAKKTTIIQGGKDWLVPPDNVAYMRQHLTAADLDIVELHEQNHFLPWNEHDLIKQKILEHLGDQHCGDSG